MTTTGLLTFLTLVAVTFAPGSCQSEGKVSKRAMQTHITASQTFSLTFSPPVGEDTFILAIPDNPGVVRLANYSRIPQGATRESFPTTCTGVGTSGIRLSGNASVISNIESLGFTAICVKSPIVDYISAVIGWMYFFVWSGSFYPQYFFNLRYKTVAGYSFNFLVLNTLGYLCYSTYNLTLYFGPRVQEEYYAKYPSSPIPVQLNDICFSVHAFFLCCATMPQFYFFRHTTDQKLYTANKILLLGFLVYFIIICSLTIANNVNFNVLDLLYYISYIKLAVTIIKYAPQVILNYKRKCTLGFAMPSAWMDFTGSVLSIAQSFLLAFNEDDWLSLITDPTKMGLGFIGTFYNSIYFYQNYILYAENNKKYRLMEQVKSIGVNEDEEPIVERDDLEDRSEAYKTEMQGSYRVN